MAATRLRVACTRVSRIRRLCAAVQRLPAIDSPARLTTAAAASISEAQGPVLPSGVHATARPADQPPPRLRRSAEASARAEAFALRLAPRGVEVPRVRVTTSWPSPVRVAARGRPRNPLPPAITIFMATSSPTHSARLKPSRSCRGPRPAEEPVKKCLTAETAETAWFDELTMSAHPEPVEGCVLRGRTSVSFTPSEAFALLPDGTGGIVLTGPARLG